MNQLTVALAGNPNCGKTTLFNSLTGARHSVGNWAGVTVEKKEGWVKNGSKTCKIIDLPGTYSLTAYSIEEKIARSYIVEEEPDVVVNIVDATNLERNLYLTLQLIELGRPVIIALNMMDEAEKKGIKIDLMKLRELFGVPVVPLIASKGVGIEELMVQILKLDSNNGIYRPMEMFYSNELESRISELSTMLNATQNVSQYSTRWLAIKLIETDEEVIRLTKIKPNFITNLDDLEVKLVNEKYEWISDIVYDAVKRPKVEDVGFQEKLDKALTNRWMGLPIFGIMMYMVFWFTFNIGNIFLDMIDVFFAETLSGMVLSVLVVADVAEWLQSLIVDGIIAGVGGVLTFLPNIAFLFVAIAILEDSGYMARVAFIMDRLMGKIGLNGKAIVPMIMGFGCNAPAIMGTRTLENENDRLIALLVNPFMSCGARLPIYVLFSAAFFPGNESLVTFSLYILGIVVAIFMALLFKKTLFKGESAPFIMELPPYRIPSVKGVGLKVWDNCKAYIVRAGTIIFSASIILWFILGFGQNGMVEITDSFGASIGKFIAPIFSPLGFGNWQASLSLLTGLVAKEVVISNMAIIYGLGAAVGEAALEGETLGFASTLSSTFTQLSAYSFMVFCLLYTPCVAVIGVIKRETNSWKWTSFSVTYQFMVAWVVAFVVYQGGQLIGL